MQNRTDPLVVNPPTSNFVTVNILADAKQILVALHKKAELMKNVTDDASQPNYGTSDQNDEKYRLTHGVCLSRESLKLTTERFYAAYELINGAVTSFEESKSNPSLRMQIRQGMEDIEINADYNSQIKYESHFKRASLPAPISKVPFDSIKELMNENLRSAFSNWKESKEDPNQLNQVFNNQNEMWSASAYLRQIEKACKEIDRSFSFDQHVTMLAGLISVNKDSFEKAKQLIGYVSMSQLVASHSPIMSNINNQSDTGSSLPIIRVRSLYHA